MEISFLNNIKKYNSRNNKENITNVMNEAFRESEEFKNNVNEKLNSENKVLVRNFDILERQYENTEVSTKTKDVITVVSSVQAGNFEATTGQDLTYLLTQKEWEEYYKKNLKFLSEKLGKNAHCVYAVIHLDESTPHLHSAWTFAEENNKENNEINYAKIDKALRNNFSNKNKKEMHLKAGTAEYKEALEKYKKENMQKQVEKQLKKMQSRTSKKNYKCETGTSSINREFYRTINEEFKNEMQFEKTIQKLKKRIELFSNEKCEIVKQRSEKYNNFETLDRAKHSMKTELEILVDKINKNDYTEQELERFKMINAKRILVEEKKEITLNDFKKKFKETKAKCRSIENNRTIAAGWNIINLKKNISNIIENNKKKKRLVNHFKEELKVLNNLKDTVNLKEIQEIIEKSTQGESAKDLINEKEQLKREIQDTKNEIYELNKKIMEQSRYDDKLNGQIYQKQVVLGELSAEIEKKKKEAERVYIPSAERIRQLEKEAVEKAEAKAKIEIDKIKKEIEKKNAELENLEKIRREREKTQNQEFENYKIFKEKREKEMKEWQVKTIDDRVREYIKNTQITDDDIDNFVLKYPSEYEKLTAEANNEIKEILKENHKEASDKIISLFAKTVQSRAKEQGEKISELEAKDITVKAIWKIPKNSDNWFKEFKENLYFLTDERVERRHQEAETSRIGQGIGTRQGKAR